MNKKNKTIDLLANLQIGCGLTRIGRIWGTKKMVVPTEEEAIDFLKTAHNMGVRVFDTAPSYGNSEERLGKFLNSLGSAASECFVSTKCGEDFDVKKNEAYVDHSPEALIRSIERSLERLPHITLLQLHKASPDVLCNDSVIEVLKRYKKSHIPLLGVCVTDPETAECVFKLGDLFDYILFPYSMEYPRLEFIFERAEKTGKSVLVSRPFSSGEHFNSKDSHPQTIKAREALEFIMQKMKWGGVILVGTINATHLKENLNLFKEIYAEHEKYITSGKF